MARGSEGIRQRWRRDGGERTPACVADAGCLATQLWDVVILVE